MIGDTEVIEIAGENAVYQVEIQGFWDDRTQRNIRVMAAIDDGTGLRSLVPLTRSLLIAPDGTLV
jgi:hypothetical protein